MKVSQEIINNWGELKEKGDTTVLAKRLKLTRQNASKVICSGEGTVRQISIITKFFEKKKEQIKELQTIS